MERQVLVAGGQPEVEAAAAALIEVLGPALREVALDLAGQAAAEVAAQLPDHEVNVVLADGDPTLKVGRRDNIEVGDSLAEGDRIVIAGQAGLKNGSLVRLVGAAREEKAGSDKDEVAEG